MQVFYYIVTLYSLYVYRLYYFYFPLLFCPLCCRNKANFPPVGLIIGQLGSFLYVLLISTWVPTGFTGFLPQFNGMHIMWIGDAKLSPCVTVCVSAPDGLANLLQVSSMTDKVKDTQLIKWINNCYRKKTLLTHDGHVTHMDHVTHRWKWKWARHKV